MAHVQVFFEDSRRFKFGLIFLILASAFVYLFNLGGTALQDYDEATYAQVINEAETSGDLLTLTLIGKPWFEKPPAYFWASMVSSKIFSNKEFAYRLPSALAGILSIILIILIGVQLTGKYTPGLLAGLILLLSPPYIDAARQVRLDVPVTAAILLGLYCFIRSHKEPVWALGVGVAVAVGVLTKSVIGLFIGPIILIWAIVYSDFSWLKNSYLWVGGVLGFLILAPWHIYEHFLYGEAFWNQYLFTHVVERFDSNLLKGAGTGSNMTYVSYLTLFAFPWTLIAVLLTPLIFLRPIYKSGNFRHLVFLGISTLFIIGFFFIAGTKLSYYLTPVYPILALFIAYGLYLLVEVGNSTHKRIGFVLGGLGLLLAIYNGINVGFHFQHQLATNNLVAEAEKDIGLKIKSVTPKVDLYAYQWAYWETLRYYSGGWPIKMIVEDQALDKDFLLVIPTDIYDQHPFPPELASHFVPIKQNEVLSLFVFKP